MTDIYSKLEKRIANGEKVILAALIKTEGSSPQIPGAKAIFSASGLEAGTLGGGPLEAAAQKSAMNCLNSQTSILKEFRMYGRDVQAEQALCGGEALLLIDAAPGMHANTYRTMNTALQKRQSGVLGTIIRQTAEGPVIIEREWIEGKEIIGPDKKTHSPSQAKEVKKAYDSGRPFLKEEKEKLLFLEPVFPRFRLIIAGAGHIGQAAAHLGHLLDFEVTVIDDREAFANKDRLPEADHILVRPIAGALADRKIEEDCFVVLVTRGHAQDADALRQCIHSKAAYIGMIGSTNKVAVMRRNFLKNGWATEAEWERIFAPIGIEISSKTIQEIAVSIAAQLIVIRNQLHSQQR